MPGHEIIGEEELHEVQQVFSNANGVLFRHGFDQRRNNIYKVKEFENNFSVKFNSPHALAVSSGTAALRVALAALNIGKDDEVITQSFTFVATVEAIIESGATPICAEIDETLNISPQSLKNLITSKTKAVIAVHMLGTPANLVEISRICKEHSIYLIEDTAWGCGGSIDNKYLGTWGDIGTFSFDFAKTMTTGEGGMITFNNKEFFDKASAWHDHGHENNPDVPRWEDTRSSSGFNFRMMELQAAVGLAQLRKLPMVVEKQRKNRDAILDSISDLNGITQRSSPDNSYDTADALVFFVEDALVAKRCRDELLKVNISTKILPEALSWHFAKNWTHMKELKTSNGPNQDFSYPISSKLLSKAVALPISLLMTPDQPKQIKKALTKAIYD